MFNDEEVEARRNRMKTASLVAPPEVADIIREAADLFEERNAVYGDNFKRVGAAMAALFPDGLTVKTAHDWNRLHILLLKIVKQTRYTQNWSKGGHEDSLLDDIAYGGMLAHIDKEKV